MPTTANTAPFLHGSDGSQGSGGERAGLDLRSTHTDLAARTYQILRDMIVTRAIQPGDKVTAEGLSRRFGVSRTTVKSALDQLAAEGLVVVRPQVGTFVRGLTVQDVHDIWDVRALIEPRAAQLGVVRASPDQRRELQELVEATAPLVEGHEYRMEQYPRFIELDRRLHELVVETAGNSFLLRLYRQTAVHIHTVSYANWRARRGLRRADTAFQEHSAIAAAYADGDAVRAAALLTGHIERSRAVALQALARAGGAI
ncbi:MAG TPA: GntR family transcriptional regulator [Chloroflexota bacterium]|nr:GntR family transcriptional regulator [Chloroflexota bacterium]